MSYVPWDLDLYEVSDCVRDLLPDATIHRYPVLNNIEIESHGVSIYVYNHLQVFYNPSSEWPTRLNSLFELQDWVVTNLL